VPHTKKPLWSVTAVSTHSGERLTMTIYSLGGLDYEISCLRRPRHLYTAAPGIDVDALRNVIADAYNAKDVQLTRIE
jgi:hypothetical protein